MTQNITNPIADTVEERVSSYFYRISLLKLQIHSSTLSASSAQEADPQNYASELEAWLNDWKEVLSRTDDPQLLRVLEAWGNMNYHHTAFLATSLARTPSENSLHHCDQIIRSCSFLARHQNKSSLSSLATPNQAQSPVFPISWPTAHLVFTAGLSTHASGERRPFQEPAERMGTVRRCLTLLGLLESDPSMLCVGFSEILEGLFNAGT